MAEIRKQALLASGVQIEGLQQAASTAAPKKVVYGNRKKKGPAAKDAASKDASPAPESRPRTPEPAKSAEEERDEWDVLSEEEDMKLAASTVSDTKDDWDESSEEEGAKHEPSEVPKSESANSFNTEFLYVIIKHNLHPNLLRRQPRLRRLLRQYYLPKRLPKYHLLPKLLL